MKVTKEQIIQKALSFFAGNDYDRASLNEIAQALGITKGGIYHYFGSKDELFHESVLYMLESMGGQLDESMDISIPLKDILRPFYQVDDVAAFYSQAIGVDLQGSYANLVYLLFSALKKFSDTKGKMESIYSRYMIGMEMLFRNAQKRGEIHPELDPEGLAFELTAFVEGGMLISSVSENLDANRVGALVFKNFWSRIAVNPDQ
jgi:AcrR family transcriptional regulator